MFPFARFARHGVHGGGSHRRDSFAMRFGRASMKP
jgi:hypothetical protein